MRKKQKREFLKSVTPVAGSILEKVISERGWTAREIAEESGVNPVRICEIKSFETYQRGISEPDLKRLMRTGFLTVGLINARLELDRDQIKYLRSLLRTHYLQEVS